MRNWGNSRYNNLDNHYKNLFGEKVYKLSLNAGMTCPNRDGKISTGGCIFCSEGGSGENAGDLKKSIREQLKDQKEFIKSKYNGKKYIAYFQAYTNTYADIDYLRKVYYEAIDDDEVVGISIATRPDCLEDDVLELIKEISKKTKVFIELGLQTIHDNTANKINRGYGIDLFKLAIYNLQCLDVEIIIHLILGLPYETIDDMIESVKYLNKLPIHGIKLHLLHILKNTRLHKLYMKEQFKLFDEVEYCEFLIKIIRMLREDIVIHRLTGDGPRHLLVAPIWSLKKIRVLNYVNSRLKQYDAYQGDCYER